MVKSKRFKSLNEKVLSHPFINSVLIYDIECSSLDTETAQVKFVGCYSYRYEKFFIIGHDELDKFELLLREHRVLVGFNNKSFDNEVLMNKVNNVDLSYKVIFDCLRVLYDTDRKRPNRELIIKHKGRTLHESLKNRKLRTVAETLGFETLKGDIDYKIFQKNHWSQSELGEIYKYLLADVDVTRLLFEFYVEYFSCFTEFVDDKNISRFDYIRSSTGSFAYNAICYMANLDYVYEDDTSKRKSLNTFKGGFVLEPKKEYAEDVLYLDLVSLYPSIYIQCNLFSNNCSCCSDDEKWSGSGFFDVKGKYCSKKRGKIESLILDFFMKRKKYKKNNDSKELPIKIFMNSLYGISSSPLFKSLYHEYCGSDCTLIGRTILEYSLKCFESAGFPVVYADTDSCFVELNGKSEDEALMVANDVIRFVQSKMPFPF